VVRIIARGSCWITDEAPRYGEGKVHNGTKSVSMLPVVILVVAFVAVLTACGGGNGDSGQTPSIDITNPTADPTYSTVWTGVIIGGTISNASFVSVSNALTGSNTIGYVFYNQGLGTWFAEVGGLGFGDNPITVTADSDGTGASTANAYITLIRPLQPLDEIFNGADQFSANTYWTDAHSFNQSHKIELYENGTGRSTTGSAFSEDAGGVSDLTWTKLGPDSVLITNCPACSFQVISRISGSIAVGAFNGQVETVGGVGELALHAFTLTDGHL
jgi:hypothetical protein